MLLITYGDGTTSEPLLTAMTLGQIDEYFAKPSPGAHPRSASTPRSPM
jgi:hypothetical protein